MHLAARFEILQLGPLTLCDAQYGADVTLAYDSPDAYQVGLPLSGRLYAHQGGRPIIGAGNLAAVSRAEEDVVIDHWSADCRQLVVKIEQEFLESSLQEELDIPVRGRIPLSGQLDIAAGPGRSWAKLVRLVAAELDTQTGLFQHPLAVGRLHEALTLGLLLAVDQPYRAALTRSTHLYRPAPVRRAIDAIHADPGHPFTVAALAGAAGVSVRTLQAGFRQYVGCTPMAYLRRVRLTRAHEALLAADPRRNTVADVAYRWGFLHLGRFAAAYRVQYHRAPSQTLHDF